jgi:hypothetical protein
MKDSKPVCDCTCHDRTRESKPCFYCANQHSFEGAVGIPKERRAVAVEGRGEEEKR